MSAQAEIRCLALVALLYAMSASPLAAGFGDTEQDRERRWHDLQGEIFGKAAIRRDTAVITIEAPERALDAALVPVTIKLARPADVRALYLVIDDNPSPVAAHFTFGPDTDAREVRLRVRINTYTNLHAVAEMTDGSHVGTSTFVKASGGCSAPMGVSDEEAMRGMGDMKLKLSGDVAAGKTTEVRLMIRHPNFNGMQMNATTRDYTPARYIQAIDVAFDGKKVFSLDSDISLASNPVISFGLRPHAEKGALRVDVRDNLNERWVKSFEVPAIGN